MFSAAFDREHLMDHLLSHGADVNVVTDTLPVGVRAEIDTMEGLSDVTRTALQAAAFKGHAHLVRKLVALGARLSEPHEEAGYCSALQAAAYGGHEEVVRMLIDFGSDVNERGGYLGSALQAAAHRGKLGTARMLLEAGALANEIDVGHFHSALLAACRIDYPVDETTTNMIKLLVEHGADVTQRQKGPYPYPLQAIARFIDNAKDSLLSFMIEKGSDVNGRGGRFGTALQAVARDGNLSSVELLLEAGADPNITGGFYNTALQAAYRHGYYQSIWALYRHGARNEFVGGSTAGSAVGRGVNGALDDDGEITGCCSTLLNQIFNRHHLDPNLVYGRYGNVLQQAIMTRDADDVAIVINAGADINKIAGEYGTAITAAAYVDDMDVFNLLLERGANIHVGNHRYPNAAFGAIRGHNIKSLKVLLEKGVDVKNPCGQFGTTLQLAAYWALLPVMRTLLRAGAEICAPASGEFGNVLEAAAAHAYGIAVRYFLRRGADVHAKGGRFGGVLNAAVLRCDVDIVELLLKKGAVADERGTIFGTPLQAAACEGRLNTVLVLLRYGADLNICRGKYRTALQAACAAGRTLIVKLLVERGADPNIVGGRYRTPLAAAAIRGDGLTVRYLLDGSTADWALVDRKKLGHVEVAVLDRADQLLLKARESLSKDPPAGSQSIGDPGEMVDAAHPSKPEDVPEKGVSEDQLLPWNVESIPHACEPYKPASSKWRIVRELSFHTLSKRLAKQPASNEPASINSAKVGGTGHLSRKSTLGRANSNFSDVSGKATLSQASTAYELDKELLPVKDWDRTMLDWVQVLD